MSGHSSDKDRSELIRALRSGADALFGTNNGLRMVLIEAADELETAVSAAPSINSGGPSRAGQQLEATASRPQMAKCEVHYHLMPDGRCSCEVSRIASSGSPMARLERLHEIAEKYCGHSPTSSEPPELAIERYLASHESPITARFWNQTHSATVEELLVDLIRFVGLEAVNMQPTRELCRAFLKQRGQRITSSVSPSACIGSADELDSIAEEELRGSPAAARIVKNVATMLRSIPSHEPATESGFTPLQVLRMVRDDINGCGEVLNYTMNYIDELLDGATKSARGEGRG